MPELDIISDLVLDTKNPRFGNIAGQSAILKYFSADPKTKALAKDIAQIGYSPLDRIIVVPRGKRYVVVEGNRRIAAAKLLISPRAAVGPKEKKFFENISKGATAAPLTADCVVLGSREEARPWIKRKHSGQLNGVGTVDWGVLEQARFDLEGGEVGRYSHLLTLVDSELKLTHNDTPTGVLAVLERVLKSKALANSWKTKFHPDGSITWGVTNADVSKLFLRVVADYRADKVSTRSINDESEQTTYVNALIAELFGKASPGGSGGHSSGGGGRASGGGSANGGSSGGRGKALTLIEPKWTNPSTHFKVELLVTELQKLSYRIYPVSASGCLRALIETTAIWYRESVMGQRPSRRDKLGTVLPSVLKHAQKNGSVTSSEAQKLLQICGALDSPESVDALNGALHNPNHAADPASIKKLWNEIQSGISQLLVAAEK